MGTAAAVNDVRQFSASHRRIAIDGPPTATSSGEVAAPLFDLPINFRPYAVDGASATVSVSVPRRRSSTPRRRRPSSVSRRRHQLVPGRRRRSPFARDALYDSADPLRSISRWRCPNDAMYSSVVMSSSLPLHRSDEQRHSMLSLSPCDWRQTATAVASTKDQDVREHPRPIVSYPPAPHDGRRWRHSNKTHRCARKQAEISINEDVVMKSTTVVALVCLTVWFPVSSNISMYLKTRL